MNTLRLSPLSLVLLAAFALACSNAAAPTASPSPSPTQPPTASPSPSPTPTPGGELVVTSPAHAAALVFASEPRFGRISPLQADLIGQSAWYEAFQLIDGFSVVVTIGSGDCQAGCINRHTWTYNVDSHGTVLLVEESGDDVEFSPGTGAGDATVTLTLVAGPVCPVETLPPDPNCAPRPVVNGVAVLRNSAGTELARAASDEQGHIVMQVPAGAYWVEVLPVEGLMGTADAQAFSVPSGESVGLVFGYDTGIR